MLRRTITTISLLSALLPGPALSATWYGDLGLGFNFARDMKLGDAGARAKFDFGIPVGSLAVGRYLGDQWRIELEYAHRDTDLEVIFNKGTGEEIRPGGGDGIQMHGFQLNAIREFRIGALEPYLGLGVGPSRVEVRMGEANNGGPILSLREPILDDETWSVGIQAIAGFNVPLTPRWDFAFDYRLWHAPSIDVTGAAGDDFDLKHTVYTGQVHLRYLFGDQRTRPQIDLRTPITGWYLTGSVATGFADDAEIRGTSENLDAFQVGPVWSLAFGRSMTRRWRLELELARRSNDVEIVDFSPILGQFRASGDARADSVTANLFYRFRPDRPIRPYLGFGAGTTTVRYDVETQSEAYLDDKATAPVVQLLGGFDIALTNQLDFVADYRMWFTYWLDVELADGEQVELSHWVHSVSLGFRYTF